MSFAAKGRLSDCAYVDSIWRGESDEDFTIMCPADGRINICLTQLNGKIHASVEGPITRAFPQTHIRGVEWLVIKFKLGVFIPSISTRRLLDGNAVLTEASAKAFWLDSRVWPHFDFENADVFASRLVRRDLLRVDPVVTLALRDEPQDLSPRSLRHHFLITTGMTQSHIRQIERARNAQTLLQQGIPILDVVDRLHYADQPHLTRSIKQFMGYTPAQVPVFELPA